MDYTRLMSTILLPGLYAFITLQIMHLQTFFGLKVLKIFPSEAQFDNSFLHRISSELFKQLIVVYLPEMKAFVRARKLHRDATMKTVYAKFVHSE
jgi:hypothetical protein